MLNELLQVLALDGVEDREEVIAARQPTLRQTVWEIGHEVLVAYDLWPQLLD